MHERQHQQHENEIDLVTCSRKTIKVLSREYGESKQKPWIDCHSFSVNDAAADDDRFVVVVLRLLLPRAPSGVEVFLINSLAYRYACMAYSGCYQQPTYRASSWNQSWTLYEFYGDLNTPFGSLSLPGGNFGYNFPDFKCFSISLPTSAGISSHMLPNNSYLLTRMVTSSSIHAAWLPR